jgi:amino acid transporter
MTVPILTYGFLGVEIVSVTAFEASNRESLRHPARFAAYGISALYFLCCLLEAVVVYWKNPNLPSLHERSTPPMDTSSSQAGPSGPGFYAVVVIAAREYGSPDAGWFFNACIIYFCISAANTALYAASRTLFGLTREIHRKQNPNWILRALKPLGSTSPYAKVPHWSLIVSAIAFFWLPFLQVNGGYSTQEVSPIEHRQHSIITG